MKAQAAYDVLFTVPYNAPYVDLRSLSDRNLMFVGGKGGVGKTAVSQAIAWHLNGLGRRVLWATFQDPVLPPQEKNEIRPGLWHVNCEAALSFEEYAGMKIGSSGLAKIFLRNKVMRYLSQAAPGIHELVLLGKVWFERTRYDHVVVDLPSTGYGLVMFESTRNFSRLFRGGPIQRDAEKMLATFDNPNECGHLIVSLPEEMPLRESLELGEHLLKIFPGNPPALLVNRLFPELRSPPLPQPSPDPASWPTPVAEDCVDYASKRAILEKYNLKIWDEAQVPYSRLKFELGTLVSGLADQLGEITNSAPLGART